MATGCDNAVPLIRYYDAHGRAAEMSDNGDRVRFYIYRGSFVDTTVVHVTIDTGVTRLLSYAFGGCDNLMRVVIPNTVEVIHPIVFSGCSRLETILFPASVQSISHDALHGCTNLRSVVIANPDTVLDMDYIAVGVHTPNLLSLVAPCIPSTTYIVEVCVKCPRIELVVVSRECADSMATGISDLRCSILPDTPANRLRALLVQYWSCEAHRRCTHDQRVAIHTVLLARERLRNGACLPLIPIEMWLAVLSFLPRRPFPLY